MNKLPSNDGLGTIMNGDHGMILIASSADRITPEGYREIVGGQLGARPGLFALRVSNPDGLSTYNWHPLGPGSPPRLSRVRDWGLGALHVRMRLHAILDDRQSIQRYREQNDPLEGLS